MPLVPPTQSELSYIFGSSFQMSSAAPTAMAPAITPLGVYRSPACLETVEDGAAVELVDDEEDEEDVVEAGKGLSEKDG
jgi:hypothetical protein